MFSNCSHLAMQEVTGIGTMAEDCEALDAARGDPLPTYYMELVYPEDLGEPGDAITIYEPTPEVLTVLRAQDVPSARIEAQGRWSEKADKTAIGYLVWQSDWLVVGGIDLVGMAT
jgi:hypothetical protein